MTPTEVQHYAESVIAANERFKVIYFILSPIVTLLLYHLIAYFKQKGQNLATKEDIGEITEKIESTKAIYTQDIERLRSDLATRSQTTTLRFKKELEVFETIWPTLHELKDKVLSLRPYIDTSSESDESREKRTEMRAEAYLKAFSAFIISVEHNRPFYPHQIWEALEVMKDSTWSEAVDWRFKDDNGREYWEQAMNNREDISNKVDALAELIRKRLSEYE